MAPVLPPLKEPLTSSFHPLALRSLLPSIHPLAPQPDKYPLPTRTLPSLDSIPRSLASLFRRQVTTVTATASPTSITTTATATPLIPANYAGLNSGPTPGTVVGIVFGSVAGFLLLLWLIYTCFGQLGGNGVSSVVEEEEVVRRHVSHHSESRHRSPPRSPSSRRHSETVRTASEVMEVRSTREHERTPPPRSPPRRESRRETVIIDEIRRPVPQEDDIVEVIEERSPSPRPKSKERRKSSGGFRHVDPTAFAGGDGRTRRVSRK